MSITEELRSWAHVNKDDTRIDTGLYGYDRLIRIADRIDEKHEEELTMERGRAITELGSDIALNYIKLPKDADGETIHLQDRMSWDNGTFDVHELNLTADGWTTWDELHGYTVRADQCHHVKPDSWERIIEDAQADGVRYHNEGRPSDFDALVERCKRLAGDVE